MTITGQTGRAAALGAADLAACERERIHVPGAIQPHGCLLACSLPGWTISSVSANADRFFGCDAAELLGKQLEDVLPAKVLHDLRNVLQSAMVSRSAERLVDVSIDSSEHRYDLTLHAVGSDAIIEIVPRETMNLPSADPVILVKSMIERLKRAPNLDRFFGLAASQVRALTGFDRVMIYKFLDDGSGEVVAEALRSGMTPFMGLHYPASDIPAQARALYKRQWLRIIPAVDYLAAALLRMPGSDAELDLSLASLRSVSPIHLEYLRNMGVGATLTVSLIEGDELWGLIACHHEAARHVSSSTAAIAELFGQVFSLQIEAKERGAQLDYAVRARRTHDRLLASMQPEETIFDNLARFHGMLEELIPSDGIGVWADSGFSGAGAVPPENVVSALVRVLGQQTATEPFATDALGSLVGEVGAGGTDIAGVLAVPFSRVPRDYLLFFRREVLQSVTWGGNPNKPVEINDAGHRIGPRKSFEAWRETVRGKSLPWLPAELQTAEALRVSLLDVILRRADIVVRERQAAHESQTFLVAELNHRVKNILALVRSLVRQSRQGAASIDQFAADLEQRVHALASAHDQLTSSGWRETPFRRLLDAEARAWADSPSRLSFEGPPVTLDSRAFQALALVLHEMMTNAAKHGSLSRPTGHLSVTWALEQDGDLVIDWTELGGPPARPPSKRGFGSVVIEQTIPFELGGEARVDYLPDGVRGRFRVPAVHVGQGEDAPIALAGNHDGSDLVLDRLLLVEDSLMIALDAQATLSEAGLKVEVAGTSAEARRCLRANAFDAAVLDINLSGETSFGVADDLVRLGMPFVFATGYGEGIMIPDRFTSIPIVSKPYDGAALRSALSSMRQSANASSSKRSRAGRHPPVHDPRIAPR